MRAQHSWAGGPGTGKIPVPTVVGFVSGLTGTCIMITISDVDNALDEWDEPEGMVAYGQGQPPEEKTNH